MNVRGDLERVIVGAQREHRCGGLLARGDSPGFGLLALGWVIGDLGGRRGQVCIQLGLLRREQRNQHIVRRLGARHLAGGIALNVADRHQCR